MVRAQLRAGSCPFRPGLSLGAVSSGFHSHVSRSAFTCLLLIGTDVTSASQPRPSGVTWPCGPHGPRARVLVTCGDVAVPVLSGLSPVLRCPNTWNASRPAMPNRNVAPHLCSLTFSGSHVGTDQKGPAVTQALRSLPRVPATRDSYRSRSRHRLLLWCQVCSVGAHRKGLFRPGPRRPWAGGWRPRCWPVPWEADGPHGEHGAPP